MKIISNILFFILMAIMLTASGMLCVLGWLIYSVLWLDGILRKELRQI